MDQEAQESDALSLAEGDRVTSATVLEHVERPGHRFEHVVERIGAVLVP